MEKAYSRINFQNSPTKTTPLSAVNLNKMDKAIDELDNRSVDADRKIRGLFTVGSIEPEGPGLWFDTSGRHIGGTTLQLSDNTDAEVTAIVEDEAYGVENATINEAPTASTYNFEII